MATKNRQEELLTKANPFSMSALTSLLEEYHRAIAKDVKHKELDGDKDSTLSGVESQPTSLGGIVPMEGGSSP